MECTICYEMFLTPKTKREFVQVFNELVQKNKNEEIAHFLNVLITPKHNNTHTCSTQKCERLFCNDCWNKISKHSFRCPFCRQIDNRHKG